MLKIGNTSPLKVNGLTVLYFYPRDNTPGCTVEACGFRDANEEIKMLGASVVGVSKDSEKSHEGFKARHNLNFKLIADVDLSLHKSFGVLTPEGKIIRSTFVIDPSGNIIKAYSPVVATGHAEEILAFLRRGLV